MTNNRIVLMLPNMACLDKLIHTVLILSRGWNKLMLFLVVLFKGHLKYFFPDI